MICLEGVSVDEHRKPPTQTEHVDTPQTSNIAAYDRSKAMVSPSNKTKDEVYSDDDPDSKRRYVNPFSNMISLYNGTSMSLAPFFFFFFGINCKYTHVRKTGRKTNIIPKPPQ